MTAAIIKHNKCEAALLHFNLTSEQRRLRNHNRIIAFALLSNLCVHVYRFVPPAKSYSRRLHAAGCFEPVASQARLTLCLQSPGR